MTTVKIFTSRLEPSKLFEKNIARVINRELKKHKHDPVNLVEIGKIGMEPLCGCNQYVKYLELSIDDYDYEVSKNSCNCEYFDQLNFPEDDLSQAHNSFLKNLILNLLKDTSATLVQEIIDNREVSK